MSLKYLADAMDRIFEEVAIKCEDHDVNMVRRKHGKAFCPICAMEKLEKENEQLREEETEKAFNVNKRWLRNRSILTDKEMLNLTFDNYEVMDAETKENYGKALKIARLYYKGGKGNSLFTGNFGTGKSHLSMAILNELNKHTDKKLIFVALDELMRRIKSSFGNPDSMYQEELMVEMLVEADVLVLDDVGAEVGSVNRKSQAGDYSIRVLNGILSGRTNKPTIFTTNLNKKGLEQTYDGRIVSRLLRGITKETLVQFSETTDKRLKIDF